MGLKDYVYNPGQTYAFNNSPITDNDAKPAAPNPVNPDNQMRVDVLGSLINTYGVSQAAIEMARSGDPSIMESELINKGYDSVGAQSISQQASISLSANNDTDANKAATNVKNLLDKYAPKTVDPTTGAVTVTPTAAAAKTKEEQLAQAMTARQMSLLQQEMGKQRAQGVSSLRGNLAQRGLMDSGSLGAGIGRINRDIGERTAQGSLMAANQEGSTLLDFLRQQREQQAQSRNAWQQRQWGLQDRAWQESQNNAQREWERKQRNRDREAQLWSGLAGAAGSLAGGWLARPAPGV